MSYERVPLSPIRCFELETWVYVQPRPFKWYYINPSF